MDGREGSENGGRRDFNARVEGEGGRVREDD